jgi:hypothetical protein
MPRFSLWSLLVVVTLAAAWCATFAMGPIGTDIRRFLQLSILTIATCSAIHHHDSRRAFWLGFLFVFLLVGCEKLEELFQPLVPHIQWARSVAQYFAGGQDDMARDDYYYRIYDTVWLLSVLSMSVVGGFISLGIYNRAMKLRK